MCELLIVRLIVDDLCETVVTGQVQPIPDFTSSFTCTIVDTVEHAVFEVTQDLIAPYKRLINRLISLFEEEMYDRKERLIEKLCELIS